MTPEQIQELFFKAIEPRGIHLELEGISEDKIYNWRKKRVKAPVGDMLDILYQLKKITVTQNEPNTN
jgi:hypothetical protein